MADLGDRDARRNIDKAVAELRRVYWYPDDPQHHHPQKFIDNHDTDIEVQRVYTEQPKGDTALRELAQDMWSTLWVEGGEVCYFCKQRDCTDDCRFQHAIGARPKVSAVHQIPDNRCEWCKAKVNEAIDAGADGTPVQNANDFLEHGGHFDGCPNVSAEQGAEPSVISRVVSLLGEQGADNG